MVMMSRMKSFTWKVSLGAALLLAFLRGGIPSTLAAVGHQVPSLMAVAKQGQGELHPHMVMKVPPTDRVWGEGKHRMTRCLKTDVQTYVNNLKQTM